MVKSGRIPPVIIRAKSSRQAFRIAARTQGLGWDIGGLRRKVVGVKPFTRGRFEIRTGKSFFVR